MAHDEYRVTELVRAIATPFERHDHSVRRASSGRNSAGESKLAEVCPGSAVGRWRTIALTGKKTSRGPDLESL